MLQTEADPTIRVGIFTATGTVFCAGSDLKEMSTVRDIRVPRVGGFAGFTETRRKKPWIAAVNGPAYGGGAEIVLACDLCVIAESAHLSLPEVKRGLLALGGGTVLLPRRLPLAVATEMLITGEPITAQRAYELGLVNRVVPGEQVVGEAIKIAQKIADNSPNSVRESLRLSRASLELPLDEMWRQNHKAMELLYYAADFKEGPRAFVEKRKAQWSDS